MTNSLKSSGFDIRMPDDDALFGNADGLIVEDMPANERPGPLRMAIDWLGENYESECASRKNAYTDGKWHEIAVFSEKGGMEPGSNGELCIVSFRDALNLAGPPVRYAVIYYDNKSAGSGRPEEVDIDIVVCDYGGVHFNHSKRMYLGQAGDHLQLLGFSSRYCKSMMDRIPLYFGLRGL
jgi:hypothetical protein